MPQPETDKLPRFGFQATNAQQGVFYYTNRMTQLLSGMLADEWSWDGNYKDLGWGIEVDLVYRYNAGEHQIYKSLYVFERCGGNYERWLSNQQSNIAVSSECVRVLDYLNKRGVEYKLAVVDKSESYIAIENYYGDRRADRTRQFLMNHIDEGLYILRSAIVNLGYYLYSPRLRDMIFDGYCLHPMFQNDGDFANNLDVIRGHSFKYGAGFSRAMATAIEYRNIANQYLPWHGSRKIKDINLSPMEEVNLMLVADKIQNRKDFEKYHLGSHPNSDGLVEYFGNWFERLQISEDFYQQMVSDINTRTGQVI